MTWEGRSCNGQPTLGTYAGAIFYGEKGSMFIDGNSYIIHDHEDNVIKEVKNEIIVDPLNIANPSSNLDSHHIQNFFGAIFNGSKLNADIATGHKSTLLVQLGNIAQRVGRSLNIDKKIQWNQEDHSLIKLGKRRPCLHLLLPLPFLQRFLPVINQMIS